nr:L,D-transpeptidase family protein [Mycolicibacterium sediminis]
MAVLLLTTSSALGNAGQATVPVAPMASVSPAPSDVVGVAHPVTITFAEPVADRAAAQRSVRFTSAGMPAGEFSWLGDDVLQWKPTAGYLPAHSTIALSVGGAKTSFQTGAAVLGVADVNAHTFTVSIDGVTAREMPASMGKSKFPTPIGSFTALEKQNVVVMDSRTIGIPLSDPEGYKLTVYDAVRVTWGGVYVHGAPWSTGAQGNSNVSHGCINLSADNADWYYNTVSVGDPIIVQA